MSKKKISLITIAILFLIAAVSLALWWNQTRVDFGIHSHAKTTGELKVLVNSPLGKNIPIATEGVTVMFDEPLVPLATLSQRREQDFPLTITPAIEGRFDWLGTKGFIFRPKVPFQPATKYHVSVPQGVRSLNGHALPKELTWDFVTVSPEVSYFVPEQGATLLPNKGIFEIHFNVAMKKSEVEKALKLTLGSSAQDLPTPKKLTWLDGDHILRVEFTNELPWEENILVELPAGLRGQKGEVALEEPVQMAYVTPPKDFHIEKVFNWQDGKIHSIKPLEEKLVNAGSAVCYHFSQAVLPSSFVAAFVSQDESEEKKTRPFFFYHEYERFYLGDFGPDSERDGYKEACVAFLEEFNSTYKFSIIPERVIALSGARLTGTEITYAVHTRNAKASLASLQTKSMLSLNDGLSIPYRAMNVEWAEARIYPLQDEMNFTRNVLGVPLSWPDTFYDETSQSWKSQGIPSEIQLSELNDMSLPLDPHTQSIDQSRMKALGHLMQRFDAKTNESRKFSVDLSQFENWQPKPGFYLLEVRGESLIGEQKDPKPVLSVVQITNVALTIKREVSQALVWATDIESGQPLANLPVHLSLKKNQEIVHEVDVVTANDGVAVAPGEWASAEYNWESTLCAKVVEPGKESYSCQNQDDLNNYRDILSPDKNYYAYLYTDRPIYLPGQTVYFSSFVREVKEGRYFLTDEDAKYHVTVRSSSGDIVYEKKDVAAEEGVVSGEFTLADGDSAPRGQYEIMIEAGQQNFSRLFFVRSYRKPTFKVDVSSKQKEIVNGDELKVDVKGQYFFGTPLKDASVDWSIMTTTYAFSPEGYEDYSFVDWDLLHQKESEDETVYYTNYEYDVVASSVYSEEENQWEDPREQGNKIWPNGFYQDENKRDVEGQKAKLNDNGSFAIHYRPNLQRYPVSQILTVEANIQDPAHQEVSASEDIIVHKAQSYLGVKSEKWAYGEKDKAKFFIASLTPEAKAYPGLNVSADFIRRDYNYIQKRNARGYWEFVSEPKDTLIKSTGVKTNADGKAEVEFDIPQGGEYRLVLKAQDQKKNPIQSAETIYAWGEGYVPWGMNDVEKLELVPDKSSYKIGDVAHVLIKSMLPVTKALVTLERGRILDYQVNDLGGNATHIDIPIVEGMIPNLFLNVVAHVGRDETHSPLLYYGETELSVEPESKRLQIQLSVDHPIQDEDLPHYKPGDPVTLSIKTMNAKNEPVPAHVIVSVADESVLRLLDYKLPDLVKKFYYHRPNQVKTSSSLQALKAGDGSKDARKRQIFKDTAHFEAHAKTDANGEAKVTFTLPDDLTTWVVEALAISDSKTESAFEDEMNQVLTQNKEQNVLGANLNFSDGTFVGSARANFRTSLPVMVRPALPRFLAVGDQAQAQIILTNQNKEDVKGELRVSLKNATFDGKSQTESQSFDVPAGSEKSYPIDVIPQDNQNKITVTAQAVSAAGQKWDEIEVSLPILKRLAPETIATSGIVKETRQIEKLDVSDLQNADEAKAFVQLKASLGMALADPMRRLIDFPWACAEQRSSALLALLMARDLTENYGSEFFQKIAPLQDREKQTLTSQNEQMKFLDQKIQDLIHEIFTKFQSYSGGMKYWPESSDTNFSASTQVLWAMTLAKNLNFDVDQTKFFDLQSYVDRELDEKKNLSDEDKAFGLWALSQVQERDESQIATLAGRTRELSVQALSYLLLADLQNSNVKQRLLAQALHEPRHVHWADSSGFAASATKNTALAALALFKSDSDNPLPFQTLPYLFARKASPNSFFSTQDDLFLSYFGYQIAHELHEEQTNFTASVTLAGQNWLEQKFNTENLLSVAKATKTKQDLDQLSGIVDLNLNKKGDGTLYYDAWIEYNLPFDEMLPREEGLVVSREYYALKDKKEEMPLTTFKTGEVYKGHITLVVPQDMNYILVKDALPAGFEAIDVALATSSYAEARQLQDSSDYDPEFSAHTVYDDEVQTLDYGMTYGFSHQEIHDDQIVWSEEFVPAGVYHIRYPVRATTAGEFVSPGAEAFEFYEPEIFGRGKAEKVRVEMP